ncbi:MULTISPECIES: amino acid ABC transporter substrate-binding protein [Bradyrhizobium]|uniref:ABC transporter substrate-binding protein n=1 Tax=Bradyrhizobium elkanii TaxID=29448 RepID=A0A4U6RHC3_BRAEL|nr:MULTISPECIES: amino acid ABC transporter substrate-binding protein [Bradyrhizobium]MTV11817.1 ABC transporter substrate-binding protein [Bradyrhizobium sp. BR2003]TKV73649.1 ABC transporter substrate-binding protein [Bradyrhizobium elkanii]
MQRRTLLIGMAAAMVAPTIVRAQGADELRIGAPLPLTGPLAPEGQKQKRGYDLWAKEVAKAGGFQVGNRRVPVRVIYSDYQSSTPRAVQACDQLVTQQRVHALFSPFGSGAAKASSAISERYKVPMIAPTASSREVYDQGYKYLFGTFTPNETLTEPLADIVMAAAPTIKRVAIFSRNDLLPLAMSAEMKKSAAKRNLESVFDEKFAIGSLDFASALTQMRSANPEWIFVGGYVNDLVQVRTQMRDLGMKPQILTMIAGPAYEEFTQALHAAAENISSASWWHPAARYKGADIFGNTERFVQKFQAMYSALPDYIEASAAAAGAILQLAALKSGSLEGPALRDALAGLDVMTFYGPISFGPTGQIEKLVPPVFQIQGGKPIVLAPSSIAQGEFRLGIA